MRKDLRTCGKGVPIVGLRATLAQGDPAANLKLSQDRANVVMAQLVSLGVDSSRLDAKAYGADHPVGDNSTIEGR